MNILTAIFALVINGLLATDTLTLEDIRRNYQLAVTDKDICQSMIERLGKEQKSTVHLAYWGAFQTLWAKHTPSPISKLNTFNAGKRIIDKVAKQAPTNVEIIFIRYSVQKNSPGFLGYKGKMEEDRKFLTENVDKITSITLKKMVLNLLES